MKTFITHLLLTDSYSFLRYFLHTLSWKLKINALRILLVRLIPHCLCVDTGTKEHASASSSPHAGMCNANRIPQLNFTNPSDTFNKSC
jgi:hypothetical protein